MADATVENVALDVANMLADPAQEVYTLAVILPFYRIAYGELWDCAVVNSIQMVDREVLYTLPAGTLSLPPATAGISNMGEPEKLWERASPGTEDFGLMDQVNSLPQQEPEMYLRWWKWEGDTFWFVGSNSNRQLKIEYQASSAPPITGNIGIDGSRSFLAARTASLLAPTRGMPELGAFWAVEALGHNLEPDASGGLLRQFIQPQVKQIEPVRPPRYRYQRPHY